MTTMEHNSRHLSRSILGTAGLGGVWGKVNPAESIDSIVEALAIGIAAIDTAPSYGDAEMFVGKALQQWNGPRPVLSTKAGRLKTYANDKAIYDYTAEALKRSLMNSMETLGVSAIDILFLHDPAAIPDREIEAVIESMVGFKQDGYIKKIGVGGNSPDWFKKYITANVFDVVMEFNRLDAACTDALNDSIPACKKDGIDYYAASPLHNGLLGNRFDLYVNQRPAWINQHEIEQAKLVKKIAEDHKMPLSSIAHRFLLTLPHDFKVVIGAANNEQLKSTLADFADGPLSENIYSEITRSLN